jgi:hypothetical protein
MEDIVVVPFFFKNILFFKQENRGVSTAIVRDSCVPLAGSDAICQVGVGNGNELKLSERVAL